MNFYGRLVIIPTNDVLKCISRELSNSRRDSPPYFNGSANLSFLLMFIKTLMNEDYFSGCIIESVEWQNLQGDNKNY